MVTKEEIAQWLRAQVSDPDDCRSVDDDCWQEHPVHLMFETNGVIIQIYCQVDGLAAKLAAWLQLKEASTSRSSSSGTVEENGG